MLIVVVCLLVLNRTLKAVQGGYALKLPAQRWSYEQIRFSTQDQNDQIQYLNFSECNSEWRTVLRERKTEVYMRGG
jgi:hypothetical protein